MAARTAPKCFTGCTACGGGIQQLIVQAKAARARRTGEAVPEHAKEGGERPTLLSSGFSQSAPKFGDESVKSRKSSRMGGSDVDLSTLHRADGRRTPARSPGSRRSAHGDFDSESLGGWSRHSSEAESRRCERAVPALRLPSEGSASLRSQARRMSGGGRSLASRSSNRTSLNDAQLSALSRDRSEASGLHAWLEGASAGRAAPPLPEYNEEDEATPYSQGAEAYELGRSPDASPSRSQCRTPVRSPVRTPASQARTPASEFGRRGRSPGGASNRSRGLAAPESHRSARAHSAPQASPRDGASGADSSRPLSKALGEKALEASQLAARWALKASIILGKEALAKGQDASVFLGEKGYEMALHSWPLVVDAADGACHLASAASNVAYQGATDGLVYSIDKFKGCLVALQEGNEDEASSCESGSDAEDDGGVDEIGELPMGPRAAYNPRLAMTDGPLRRTITAEGMAAPVQVPLGQLTLATAAPNCSSGGSTSSGSPRVPSLQPLPLPPPPAALTMSFAAGIPGSAVVAGVQPPMLLGRSATFSYSLPPAPPPATMRPVLAARVLGVSAAQVPPDFHRAQTWDHSMAVRTSASFNEVTAPALTECVGPRRLLRTVG